MTEPEIVHGYLPGSIGRVVEMHGAYYAKNWQFGVFFEARLASEMASFLTRYNADRDRIWFATINGRTEGTITIDGLHGMDEGAHLRWFIMSDALRGQGIGGRLMNEAVEFSRSKGYPRIFLHTFAGLHAARKLYERAGFELVYEAAGAQWGTKVTEQKFVLECQ